MKERQPAGQMPDDAAEILTAYEAGHISADAAAEQFMDALERAGASVALELDRSLREAILRLLIARGKLPPDTVFDPEE